MLDVLVTVSLDTPRLFIATCLESVKRAAEFAPFKVNTIIVPGVPGHIGRAMMNGLARSTGQYVCWVDDDDYVLPNAFDAIADALAERPVAVCAREVEMYANGTFKPCENRHHLTAYRADWVNQHDLLPFRATPNVALLTRLPTDAIDVPAWVYIRRNRVSGGMKLRGEYQQKEAALWL